MGRLFDIMVHKEEKIVKMVDGMYQTFVAGVALTEKDVPEPEVRLRTLELQKQVKVALGSSQVLDGVKSVEEISAEVKPYTVQIERLKEALEKK
jgi:hypothetical protein